MLNPEDQVDHIAGMNDSVELINELLLKDRTEFENAQLKANAQHLLIMAERLGVTGYEDIANQALAAL